jgi:PEP-CTERM motif
MKAVFLAAGLFCLAGAASAADVTMSNGTGTTTIGPFGSPNTQTFGEVFTPTISGELTSFTLSLNAGVGSLYGGVGAWNGGPDFVVGAGSPVNLYTSANVASTGAQSFTFSPDVAVTKGVQYVAYLCVFDEEDANAVAEMPSFPEDNVVTGINYFVYNNYDGATSGDPAGNPAWNYSAFNHGTAQFSFTVSDSGSGTVPEPSTWAMLLLGFAGLGYAGHRKVRSAASIA